MRRASIRSRRDAQRRHSIVSPASCNLSAHTNDHPVDRSRPTKEGGREANVPVTVRTDDLSTIHIDQSISRVLRSILTSGKQDLVMHLCIDLYQRSSPL